MTRIVSSELLSNVRFQKLSQQSDPWGHPPDYHPDDNQTVILPATKPDKQPLPKSDPHAPDRETIEIDTGDTKPSSSPKK